MNPLQKKFRRLSTDVVSDLNPILKAVGLEEIPAGKRRETGSTILEDDSMITIFLWIKGTHEGTIGIETENEVIKFSFYLSRVGLDTIGRNLSAVMEVFRTHTNENLLPVTNAAKRWLFAREILLRN